MSFKELNLYYQYAECINETTDFYNKSLIYNKFNSDKSSYLQLLSISLKDTDIDYFILIKIIINIINSYSALFSQTDFTNLDFNLIQTIIFILYLLILILETNYKKLSDDYGQNLLFSQVSFIIEGDISIDYNSNARLGYYKTLWPNEMCDLYRSHCVLNGGLPINIDSTNLKITTYNKLQQPCFGCTRKKNEIYIVGGSPFLLGSYVNGIINETYICQKNININYRPYISKFNYDLSSNIVTYIDYGETVNYIGGLLIHENNFIYAVAKSVVYKLDSDTLQIINYINLPLLNKNDDIVYTIDKESIGTIYNGMQVLKNGRLLLKGFLSINLDLYYSLLLQIDPNTLEIKVIKKTENNGTTDRLTVYTDINKEQYIYGITSNNIIRYLITDDDFILDSTYTKEYRTNNDGSTIGSSIIIFDNINHISLANNTICGPTNGMKIFSYDINPNGNLISKYAFENSSPGYNFFMIGSDNIINNYVICYDPIVKSISCNKLYSNGNFEFIWQTNNLTISACIAIVVNKDHIYINDYVNGYDYFVVLSLSTGKELARIKTEGTAPTISGIFPGMNNDVYLLNDQIGNETGYVTRIYVSDEVMKFKSLNNANNNDRVSIYNKLNEHISISSNEKYKNILKYFLNI